MKTAAAVTHGTVAAAAGGHVAVRVGAVLVCSRCGVKWPCLAKHHQVMEAMKK